MANEEKLVGEVTTFVDKAKSVGIYNASQATNLQQALKLALDQAKASGCDITTITVAQARDGVSAWLDEYGGQNKASAQSIATYNGRAKKVLEDFISWNGGDFMSWKRTLAKSPKAFKLPRKAKTGDVEAPPSNGDAGASNGREQTYILRLPGGKLGKLTLPEPITSKQITAAWRLLDAHKTVLETQAEIAEDNDEAGEGAGPTSDA